MSYKVFEAVMILGIIALGGMFFGESMFSTATDASKVAFVHFVRQLKRWEFELIDCQIYTSHLETLGATEIHRSAYTQLLNRLCDISGYQGEWEFDEDIVEDV